MAENIWRAFHKCKMALLYVLCLLNAVLFSLTAWYDREKTINSLRWTSALKIKEWEPYEKTRRKNITTLWRRRRLTFTQLKKSNMMFPPFPACRSPAGGLNVISSIPTTSPHYWVNRFGHVLSKQSQDWQLREWGEWEAASFPIRVASGKTLKRRSILQIAKLILSQAGDI